MSEVLGVEVSNYRRNNLTVAAEDADRLSIKAITARIENLLDTNVVFVKYSYKVEVPTYSISEPYYAWTTATLRDALADAEMTEGGIDMSAAVDKNRLTLHIRGVFIKTPRELEAIIRSVL